LQTEQYELLGTVTVKQLLVIYYLLGHVITNGLRWPSEFISDTGDGGVFKADIWTNTTYATNEVVTTATAIHAW